MTRKNRMICFSVLLTIILLFVCGTQKNKEQTEKHYRSALALFPANKADSAFIEIQQAIKLDPKHIQAHQRYANMMRIDSFDLSNTIYQELLRTDTTRYCAYSNSWRNIIDKDGRSAEVKEKISKEIEEVLAKKKQAI